MYGNPSPSLGQAQKYDGVKPLTGITTPFDYWISSSNPYALYKQRIKTFTDSLLLKHNHILSQK